MGWPPELVFPDQQTFAAVSEDGAHVARVLRGLVSGQRESRRLCFKAALFVRRPRGGYGTDAGETGRHRKAESMDPAKKSPVRGIRSHARRPEIEGGNSDDVRLAERRSGPNVGE